MTLLDFSKDVQCWENQNDWASIFWRNYDDMLSHLDTIPERYRQTDGWRELLYQHHSEINMWVHCRLPPTWRPHPRKLILAILFDWQRIYLNDSIIGETRTSLSSHQAVVNHFSEFFAYWHVLRARRCTTVHFWNQTCNHLYLKNSTVCVCVFQ